MTMILLPTVAVYLAGALVCGVQFYREMWNRPRRSAQSVATMLLLCLCWPIVLMIAITISHLRDWNDY